MEKKHQQRIDVDSILYKKDVTRQRKCCCKMLPFIIINELLRTDTYRLFFIGC